MDLLMLIKICSYIKNKFKENNLSWRIVCPPGIIQLIRSIILYPSNFETPVEPLFIWHIRFCLSIIAILLGLICFFKPRIYYICTIPLCGWGLFMIYQNQIAIGFLLYIFGCFVYTKKEFLSKFPLSKSIFMGILITSVNFLCFFNGGWNHVISAIYQELIILFILGLNIILMLPEINYYIKTKRLCYSVESFDLQTLSITYKDFQIIKGVLNLKNYKEIADELIVSESYVKKFMSDIFRKTDVKTKEDFITVFGKTIFINIPDENF